jgi:hypothetical protein
LAVKRHHREPEFIVRQVVVEELNAVVVARRKEAHLTSFYFAVT